MAKSPKWEVAIKYSRGRGDESLPGKEAQQRFTRKGVRASRMSVSVNTLVQHIDIYLHKFDKDLKKSKMW